MESVFLYHVVGDLTVGKPDMVEFCETETLESAIRAIRDSTETGIPVWKRKLNTNMTENNGTRQQRFVGVLSSLDIVSFLARTECLEDQDEAMRTPISEIVVPDNSLLQQVDPATRLIDALEMMKHGARHLVVQKSKVVKWTSKRFSISYNNKWIKNVDCVNLNASPTSTTPRKFCCLSMEDIIRFLIGCMGALAPIPLSTISSLGAINQNFSAIEASLPALAAKQSQDWSAVAVVESGQDGRRKIIGEVSASRLRKSDYWGAAWALANLSAGQYVSSIEDNGAMASLPNVDVNPTAGENGTIYGNGLARSRKFSSRSIGFKPDQTGFRVACGSGGIGGCIHRGRSMPLTCKATASLAAVMAQMVSYRATHVWVTEGEGDDAVVGVVGCAEILDAVTKNVDSATTPFSSELQN